VDGILGCVESGIDRIKRKDCLHSWTQSKAARVVAAMLMPTDSVLQTTVLPKGKPCPYSDRKPPFRSKVPSYVVCAGSRIREFITSESGLFEPDEYLAL
jgi:hypothetical protein